MLRQKLRNLPRADQRRLAAEFAGPVAEISSGVRAGKACYAISVFDHWLSEQEALGELNSVSAAVQAERDERLHTFICSLTSKTEAFPIKMAGRYKGSLIFKQFRGEEARRSYLRPAPYNVGNGQRYVLALPTLGALYVEGCDFTHDIYLLRKEAQVLVRSVAAEAGLHVLE